MIDGLLGGSAGGTGSTGRTGTATSPVTVTTADGGLAVDLGGTTVAASTGDGLGVGMTTGSGAGVGVQLGGTSTGAAGAVSVTDGADDPAPTVSTDPASGTTPSPVTDTTSTVLTSLSATAQYATVYPAKDGYRDTEVFTLSGTTSDGQQHAATGTAQLTFGSSTVATWPISSTGQTITWNGLMGGTLVPGRYILSATIGDTMRTAVSGRVAVDVSAKKLASTTSLLSTRSVSGTHTMATKPREGFAHGRVMLRITSVASHVKGRQYLVFSHAGKHVKVRVLNGKHTSGAVSIPKSFTTYTVSHTWRKGTVKVRSLKYRYTYWALR